MYSDKQEYYVCFLQIIINISWFFFYFNEKTRFPVFAWTENNLRHEELR